MSNKEIGDLEIIFERLMRKSFELFGENNFRLIAEHKSTINLSIMDSICYFIDKKPNALLEIYKEQIKKNYEELLINTEYLDAVRLATSSKEKVKTRFHLANKILSKI